jgi:hypothetical protein
MNARRVVDADAGMAYVDQQNLIGVFLCPGTTEVRTVAQRRSGSAGSAEVSSRCMLWAPSGDRMAAPHF